MRKYNKSVAYNKTVRFFGFDSQIFAKSGAIDSVRNYLKRVDTLLASQKDNFLTWIYKLEIGRDSGNAYNKLQTLLQRSVLQKKKSVNAITDTIRKELSDLVAFFAMKKGDYIHRSSNHEYETNFYRVINLFQYFDAHDPTMSRQQQLTNYRDSYMASNFKNFVQQNPDIKIVLWAHNGHISKYPNKKLLGGLLNEAYGSAYFPVSFAFNKGSFQSIELKNGKTKGLKEFTVTEAKDGTFDWYLAQAKKDNFILNFRQKSLPNYLTNFVGNSFRTRSFGSLLSREGFNERYFSTIVGKDFDAVIFINTTTRSRPTPTGMR